MPNFLMSRCTSASKVRYSTNSAFLLRSPLTSSGKSASNLCAIEPNRDNWNVAGQRATYFDAHEVLRIVETPFACLRIKGTGPSLSHEDEQHFALLYPTLQNLHEVAPRWDRINVHEMFSRSNPGTTPS